MSPYHSFLFLSTKTQLRNLPFLYFLVISRDKKVGSADDLFTPNDHKYYKNVAKDIFCYITRNSDFCLISILITKLKEILSQIIRLVLISVDIVF